MVLAGPTTQNDSAITCTGNPVNIAILSNDFSNSPATSIDSSSVDLGPGSGKSLLTANGLFVVDPQTGLVTFTPSSGFQGTITIQYSVKDNLGVVSNQASIKVTVISSPNSYALTGGGNYCQGTYAGVGVGLTGSDIGINYQLLINGVNSGASIPGTGSPIYFGSQTTVGTYRVQATNPVTGCSIIMNSSASVNSIPPPNSYTVGGGGIGCNGGSGPIITLSNSDLGVNYQLQNGSLLVGSPIPGTGMPLSFPPVSGSSGNYVVTATNTTTSCTATMNGSAMVTIYSNPTLYTVSGSNLCEGNLSNDIKLSGSQLGVNYQLLLNGVPIGNPVSGTGLALHFLGDTAAGSYRIIATNISGCFSTMRNGAVVSPSPNLYVLSPKTQNYCPGSPRVTITLSNSDIGVNYQLVSSGSNYGNPLAGTGSSLTFGPLLQGTYWVVATNAGSNCSALPTDTVKIIQNPQPMAFTLNPQTGHYCAGFLGAQLYLSGSETGVNYQLYAGSTPVGSAVPGTGNPLNFGFYPAGTYTVSAISIINSCTPVISDTATLVQDSLPNTFLMSPDTAHYCMGTSGVVIGLLGSQNGVSYQLLKNGIPLGVSYPGTGSSISFGLQTYGNYSVIALNNTTNCGITMPNTSTLIQDSLPKAYALNPKNVHYCSGSPGDSLTLSGSQIGINYFLLQNGNSIGFTVPGTGLPIKFGYQPQGNYSVLAINPKSGCSVYSLDTATIQKDSLPNNFTLSAFPTHYCIADTGVHLLLSGSELGVKYQVLMSGVPMGNPVNGTGIPLDLGLFKAGTYTVSQTNLSPCSVLSNAIQILVDSLPKHFNLLPLNAQYCSGNGLDLTLSGSQIGVKYQLYSTGNPIGNPLTGNGSPLDFGIQGQGNYYVQGSSSTCSLIISDSTTISKGLLPSNFLLSGNPEYCPGTTGTNLTLSGSQVGVQYQLENGAVPVQSAMTGNGNPLIFTNIPSGSYLVIATSAGGCSDTMNSRTSFLVKSPMSGSVLSHFATCSNPNSGSLKASITGGTTPYIYLWNNGSTDSLLTNLATGTYTVQVTDALGCTLSLSGMVKPSVPPVVSSIQTSTGYEVPVSFSLSNFIMGKDTTINYKTVDLDPSNAGIQNSRVLPNMGMFLVDSTGKVVFTPASSFVGVVSISYTVQDNNGCLSDTGQIQITVKSQTNVNNLFTFPQLFTPNGDGFNDTFIIDGLQTFPNNTLEIYNRWGGQVFYAQGYLTNVSAWTGNGLGEGTYYYILHVTVNGENKTYSGFIALIRSMK